MSLSGDLGGELHSWLAYTFTPTRLRRADFLFDYLVIVRYISTIDHVSSITPFVR